MSTSGIPDRTTHPVPAPGSPRPMAASGARRAPLPYSGIAVALVLAVKLADLVSRHGVTPERGPADGAPAPVVAEAHQQEPTADGDVYGADGEGVGEGKAPVVPSPSHEPMPQPWEWTVQRRVSAAVQSGAALVLIAVALAPPVLELAERNVRVHHLQHAALLGGGGVLGLILGLALRPPGHRIPWERHPKWRQIALGVVLLGPLAVMAAMVPSTSAWIDTHPLAHALEHLTLIVLAGVIGLSARLFSTALGWLVVVLVATMAAAFGAMALDHPLGLLVAGLNAIMPPA